MKKVKTERGKHVNYAIIRNSKKKNTTNLLQNKIPLDIINRNGPFHDVNAYRPSHAKIQRRVNMLAKEKRMTEYCQIQRISLMYRKIHPASMS